jgi:hypothetical protein
MEFQGKSSRQLGPVVAALRTALGPLEQVGGPARIYEIGDGEQVGAVYVLAGSMKAIGVAGMRDTKELGITTIYVWSQYYGLNSAEYAIDIPITGDFKDMVPLIASLIKNPRYGKFEVKGKLSEATIVEARQCSADEFIKLARQFMPDKVHKLSIIDMTAIAKEYDVRIPGGVRANPQLKVDAHHWNLSGEGANTDAEIAKALGGTVEPAAPTPPEYDAAIELSKIKTVSKLAGMGKIYLMGRKANGAFFRVPGLEGISAQMERLLANQLEAGGDSVSMEEQYEMLHDRVSLVAGGKSQFIKSLLITGAPSSGKTFTVMQTINNDLGLKEGVDYVVKKGRITTVGMYRTLIEQIDGLVIFDDCDSVVDDKNAINMLKGALDTDPIREISYDVRGTINTAVMLPAERDEMVLSISRILRGKGTPQDLAEYRHLVEKPEKESRLDEEGADQDEDDWSVDPADGLEPDEDSEPNKDVGLESMLQEYFTRHLPNKIGFRGRIIFISNMDESEWDSAILTRAFTMNMNFTNGEMLDYIDKIKGHIKTPDLSDEEKQEVMDYVRELWVTGNLKRQVNFRLIQQAFDLRLTSNWKKMLAML